MENVVVVVLCEKNWRPICCCRTLEREGVSSASCKAVIYDADQRKVGYFANQVWLSYGHMQNGFPVGGNIHAQTVGSTVKVGLMNGSGGFW